MSKYYTPTTDIPSISTFFEVVGFTGMKPEVVVSIFREFFRHSDEIHNWDDKLQEAYDEVKQVLPDRVQAIFSGIY